MLFWPQPSERLSSVDFTGFWGTWEGEGRQHGRRGAWGGGGGIWWRRRSRCGSIRSNPFQLPGSPIGWGGGWRRMAAGGGGAWLGRQRRRLVTGPRWRDGGSTCATRSRGTIVWVCQRGVSGRPRQADGSVTGGRGRWGDGEVKRQEGGGVGGEDPDYHGKDTPRVCKIMEI